MVGDKKPEGDKLVIYDMPLDLIKQWISLTKLFFNNKMCLAMADAKELLLEKYSNNDKLKELESIIVNLNKRVDDIEIVLNVLLTQHKKEEPKEFRTFGGEKTNEKLQTG